MLDARHGNCHFVELVGGPNSPEVLVVGADVEVESGGLWHVVGPALHQGDQNVS